ncbi:29871_t:CDS:2, partial [Gigaspora margarita]
MKEIIIIETNKQGLAAAKFRKQVKDFLNKTDVAYQIYQVQDELTKEENDEDDLEQMKNEKDKRPLEQRPVLVISKDWQNEKNNRIIGVPLSRTLKPFYEGWEVKVRVNNQDGKIMVDQESRGGVGKSTLSQALATEASQQELKTLLADYDPQQKT